MNLIIRKVQLKCSKNYEEVYSATHIKKDILHSFLTPLSYPVLKKYLLLKDSRHVLSATQCPASVNNKGIVETWQQKASCPNFKEKNINNYLNKAK